MISKELLDYLDSQKDTKQVSQLAKNFQGVIASLKDIKKELSSRLPELFMKDDIDEIQKCINFGDELSKLIGELSKWGVSAEGEEDIPEETAQTDDGDIIHTKMKLQVVDSNVCLKCGNMLINTKTPYYKTVGENGKVIQSVVATYECPNCKNVYIHRQMADLLNESETNIELIRPEEVRRVKLVSVDRDKKNSNTNQRVATVKKPEKACIFCGKPVWGNTDYCRDHSKYMK